MKELKEFANELPKEVVERIVKLWLEKKNFGKLKDYDGYGKSTGSCGETIEIFLKINGNKIEDAKFFTDGCVTSVVCGSITAELAKNKSIEEVLKIRSIDIIDELGGLPEEEIHCAIIAENALKEAISSIKSYTK